MPVIHDYMVYVVAWSNAPDGPPSIAKRVDLYEWMHIARRFDCATLGGEPPVEEAA